MGIPTEFDVELRRPSFTVRHTLRVAVGDRARWIHARMSLDAEYVLIVTSRGIDELRPSRLAWRGTREFLISGTDRRFLPSRSILRFRTDIEAKQASSAIGGLGRVTQELVSEETPAEIQATVLVGPLFLAYLALFALPLVLHFLRSIVIDRFFVLAYSVAYIFLFFFVLSRIVDRQSKAGPAVAWFRPRKVKAWLSVDEDDLMVRTLWKREGYRPSMIEWRDSRSFTVREGTTTFQLVFPVSDDALKVASMIKKSFPQVHEAISGMA